MLDFNSSFQASDFDWEFDAPHWYDFEEEDNISDDSWFDEQEKKMHKISELLNSRIAKEKKEGNTQKIKHPTRIPVPNSRAKNKDNNNKTNRTITSAFVNGSQTTRGSASSDDKSKPSIHSTNSKFYSKLPVRIPLKEKRNSMKH